MTRVIVIVMATDSAYSLSLSHDVPGQAKGRYKTFAHKLSCQAKGHSCQAKGHNCGSTLLNAASTRLG